MKQQDLIKRLVQKTDSKIVLLVMDGLGSIPHPEHNNKTELEVAQHPNLDRLVTSGVCGVSDPVMPGITPGSGPAHLSLFGYDPLEYEIGRGLLDTLGIDFDFSSKDVAARGNFATVNNEGVITDRRAGRIATEENERLCKLLSTIKIPGVDIFLKTVKEHRFSVIFRGENLSDLLEDSDPQKEGLKPLSVVAKSDAAQKTANIINAFIKEAEKILHDAHPANMLLLRGFAKMIHLAPFHEVYQLNPAAIAIYPMYRGLSKLLGMDVLEVGDTIETEFDALEKNFANYDFFFMHIKKTDSYGEDGNFDGKVHIIEEVDSHIPRLMALNPDVIIITGDHSTPSYCKAHSWHPVPTIVYSKYCGKDMVTTFNEITCLQGALGRISAQSLMPLALANAGKLMKFGA